MGNFFGIIFAIIIYIIRISIDSAYTSRRNGYGRYGTWGMQDDFSLEYDPLADIRQTYNERLQIYYMHNKPKMYLINKNCEARFINDKNGNMWFYVKERTNGKTPGKYFEVKGDNNHASTMWAIIDMEFNSLTRYSDIKSLYYKLNQGFETRGGLKYFSEPILRRLPQPEINKCAQNEYCRMEIQQLQDNKKIILCSEIWAYLQYNQPRRFVIIADRLILYAILSEFSNNKNKMINYVKLLYKYSDRDDCSVKELNDNIKLAEQKKSAQELLQEQEVMQEPEPIKYIHVDIDEQKEDKKEVDIPQEQEIKKYDERNLDL